MDTDKLIARVKAILMTPKTEWPVIAAEPATVPDLYKNYIVFLAAIPAIAGFIKGSLIGYGGFGFHFRTPIGAGITGMIVTYALSLALIYVMALIVNALAPTFDGQKNPIQAMKVVAYAYTASWIAGAFQIIPGIGWLVMLAGGIYSIYLLYLGLSPTMKSPVEKSGGYTAVSIVIAIVLSWIIMLIVGGIIGTGAMMGGAAMSGAQLGNSSSDVTIDKDSALGKLNAFSKNMEAASKQMQTAQKSGDADAQGKAIGAMLGAATGSGTVEALAPAMLKPFVPDSLSGLKRTEVSAERNGAMGMQFSEARGTYSDGAGKSLNLEISDLGSAKGMLALAGWAGQWDSQSKSGEYSIVLGDRFTVKVSGNADSMDQLKAAVASLNLGGLEALKDQGVKKG